LSDENVGVTPQSEEQSSKGSHNDVFDEGIRMKRPSNRFAGFTLIELLIVISIIALLAAILFPVFARARENARRSACQSNMKQMGLAFTQYVQDNDGRYPQRYWACGTAAGRPAGEGCPFTDDYGTLWYHALNPYVKNVQIWTCPSTSDVSSIEHLNVNGVWFYTSNIAYGWNSNRSGDPFDKRLEADIADPTGTLLVTETVRWTGGNSYRATGRTPTPANRGRVTAKHFTGANVLWADGHVKWISLSALQYPADPPDVEPGLWTLAAGD
jgi:prepilin-type N-terminal cleavage/methylation domain-containing protein/prepilin-type processing-associated H-X9-DG protein